MSVGRKGCSLIGSVVARRRTWLGLGVAATIASGDVSRRYWSQAFGTDSDPQAFFLRESLSVFISYQTELRLLLQKA